MSVDSQVSRDLIVADIVARTGIDEAMIKRFVRAFYGRARSWSVTLEKSHNDEANG